MPKPRSLLDYFPNLNKIPIESIASSLESRADINLLGNYFGNKILYPGTVSETVKQVGFDLLILKAALMYQGGKYYNKLTQKVFIEAEFLNYVPDLAKLATVFIDVFKPAPLATFVLKGIISKNIGTLIKPEIAREDGLITLRVSEKDTPVKRYQIKFGKLQSIPVSGDKIDLKFESLDATLFGKNSIEVEVVGGPQFGGLGIIVDARGT